MELREEEKRAKVRLKALELKKQKLLVRAKKKARVDELKKKIREAKAKGKTTYLTPSKKEELKSKANKVAKKTGFVLDVIAYGYAGAKGKGAKKKRY